MAAHAGGFHVHVAEHEAAEYDSMKKSGMRVVDRLGKTESLARASQLHFGPQKQRMCHPRILYTLSG